MTISQFFALPLVGGDSGPAGVPPEPDWRQGSLLFSILRVSADPSDGGASGVFIDPDKSQLILLASSSQFSITPAVTVDPAQDIQVVWTDTRFADLSNLAIDVGASFLVVPQTVSALFAPTVLQPIGAPIFGPTLVNLLLDDLRIIITSTGELFHLWDGNGGGNDVAAYVIEV